MIVAAVTLVLLALVAVLPTVTARVLRTSWVPPALQLVLLATAGVLAPFPDNLTGFPRAAAVVLGVAAAAGGASPLVRGVFRLAGREPSSTLPQQNALRGGGVIGVLERASVSAAIFVHWPAGIAIVLAVKGLARYPELREAEVSEQFIIGTFTSVLWAAACSGVVITLIR